MTWYFLLLLQEEGSEAVISVESVQHEFAKTVHNKGQFAMELDIKIPRNIILVIDENLIN